LTFLAFALKRAIKQRGRIDYGPLFYCHLLPNVEEDMANTPQARKRIRRNERRTIVNRSRVSRIRTLIKKVENALVAGDKDAAAAALVSVQPELMRGVAKGVVHKNTASRKFSRLTKAVSALA
jgi:small subunit ribosomal protein S20